jgi:hypothetical protein
VHEGPRAHLLVVRQRADGRRSGLDDLLPSRGCRTVSGPEGLVPMPPYYASARGISQDMTRRITCTVETFAAMGRREKLERLRTLSDLVWDIEDELAQAKAVRASLMTSLQSDLRQRA